MESVHLYPGQCLQHHSAIVQQQDCSHTCREIRRRDVLHKLLHCEVWVADQRAEAVNHFSQIVRRDVSGNPHCDASSPIHQEVWYASWEHGGLFLRMQHRMSAADRLTTPRRRASSRHSTAKANLRFVKIAGHVHRVRV